jgi:hypothetical protein
MATFLPGQTDQFGPLQLHTPDYSFLTQAYGAKQAQYDRGFNAVKNVYNSLLNSSLSNAENEEFRKKAFDKIQDSLKSVSGVDLSDPNTVRKAMGIMDPISNDKELAYDMYVTKYNQSQKELMNQYKNSTDPEKRKLYNEQAERYIQQGEEDLRNARRGTGEITNVRPKDFVPFEDVVEFLDAAAQKQGLKVKKSEISGGYILENINGSGAIPVFEEWAKARMGTRFDRQFQVQGVVQAETAIRNIAKTQNVSKEQAREIYAQQVYEPMMEKLAEQGQKVEKELAEIDKKINLFESIYGKKEPTDPRLIDYYNNLKEHKKTYTAGLDMMRQRTADFQNKGLEYVSRNLEGLFSEEAKNQISQNWASTKAMVEEEQTIKPDQFVISQLNMQNQREITALQINAANARHISTLASNQEKFKHEHSLKLRQQEFEEQMRPLELQLKQYGIDSKSGTQSAKKGTNPFMEFASKYTPREESLFSVDILQGAAESNTSDLPTVIFDPYSGVLPIVERNPLKRAQIYSSVRKLEHFAQTGENKLTKEDMQVLNTFSKNVGSPVQSFDSKESASIYFENLQVSTFKEASNNSAYYLEMDASEELLDSSPAYLDAMAKSRDKMDGREQIFNNMKRISEVVLDENGEIKPQYLKEGLRVSRVFGDGTMQFDFSQMTNDGKKLLESYVDPQFRMRTNPTGQVYTISGFSNPEVFALTNANIFKNVSFSGENLPEMFSKLNETDFKDVFNNEAVVSYNPITKEAIFEFTLSTDSSISKSRTIKNPETATVTVPYQSLTSNPSLKRLADAAIANTVNTEAMGKFAPFMANPESEIQAPFYIKNSGFDYHINGIKTKDNLYGLNQVITFLDPDTKEWITTNRFIKIDDPSNPKTWADASLAIDMMYENYKRGVKISNQKKETESKK